jgi:hypothetical protein
VVFDWLVGVTFLDSGTASNGGSPAYIETQSVAGLSGDWLRQVYLLRQGLWVMSFYLQYWGRRDGDGDGVPCESLRR